MLEQGKFVLFNSLGRYHSQQKEPQYLACLREALESGEQQLKGEGEEGAEPVVLGLTALAQSVCVLENSPLTNAGHVGTFPVSLS